MLKNTNKLTDQLIPNTGFGTNASSYGGRLINKDGSYNLKKSGVGFFEKFSWFHSMLTMSRFKFFLIILCFFISVNLLFTVVYYLVGVHHLKGLDVTSELDKFLEAFFFSTQTFTTVGYGRISPSGFVMSAVSSFQALIGLLSFALATGLMYGRFGMPKAYIKFSTEALISPYQGGTGLMLRFTPFKNTPALIDVEAKISLAIIVNEKDTLQNRFYNLALETNKINALALSWTLVHPIDKDSPLWGFSSQDFENTKGELLVYIKAFDDTFSNNVIARTSYTFGEIRYGKKFTPMYKRDDTGQTTVLHVELLNTYTEVTMPLIN